MSSTLKFLLLALLTLLVSCSRIYGQQGIIKGRETDYLEATSVPPLKIPPGVSSSKIDTHFPVPQRSYPESAKQVNLVPPDL